MDMYMKTENHSAIDRHRDDFGVFLDEILIPAYEHRLKTSALHRCHTVWAKDNGVRSMRSQDFVAELRCRFDVRRDCLKGNVIVGFNLKEEPKAQLEMLMSSKPKAISAKHPIISTDFISVSMDEEQPDNRFGGGAGGGLRVKVGAYEFEADAGFPMGKLAELLRGLPPHDASVAGTPGLGGEASC